jgi:polysaccharide lyase-like protein/Big-like domain-containing protein
MRITRPSLVGLSVLLVLGVAVSALAGPPGRHSTGGAKHQGSHAPVSESRLMRPHGTNHGSRLTGRANNPPRLSLSWAKPKPGATVSGQLIEHAHNCIARVRSTRRIHHVSFYRDSRRLNTQLHAPYSCVWDTTKAREGSSHTLRAVARDRRGNRASARVRVTVHNADTTKPQTTIAGGASGTIGTSDVSFSFSSSEAGSSFDCRLDSGSWTSCSSPEAYTGLADAAHGFDVRATDSAGNTDRTPASRSFTVDTAPPIVAWTTPQDGGTVSGRLIESAHNCIVSASSGFGIDHVTFRLDGTMLNTQQSAPYSCTWDTTTAADGSSHTLEAVAYDANGHAASASVSVTVDNAPPSDTTPPETTITAGPSGTITTSSASFSFSSSEAGSSFECRLDGGSWTSCSSPEAYSGLPDGAHSFAVQATDGAGNTDPTPASGSFTVDTSSPDTAAPETTITAGPSGTITTSSASFSFSSSEAGSSFTCRLDAGAWGSCTSPKAYSGLSDGAHTFIVTATDAANNTDATAATRSFTVDTGGGAGGAGYPSIAIDWDGDFDSGCQLVGSAGGAWDYNETNADHTGGSTTIERSIVGEGQCAARFTNSASGDMTRSELQRSATGADPEFTYEMLVRVPSGQTFPKGSSLTQTKQEKSGGRGCYNGGLGVADDTGTTGGQLDLTTVFACTSPQKNGQRSFALGALPRDQWFALKVYEKFSNDAEVGFIQAWKDADGLGPGRYVEVVPKTHVDNETGQHVRLRIGSYRQGTDHTTTVYIDGVHLDCASGC